MKRHNKTKGQLGRTVIIIVLGLAAVITCYPILFLLVGSFKSGTELSENLKAVFGSGDSYASYSLLPLRPTINHYIKLLLDTPSFFVMFWNSIKITGGAMLGQMLFGLPAAWGFARYRFRGKQQLFLLYIVLMLMPFQVLMLSEYLALDRMKLMDTVWTLILPGAFSTFPVFIMYQFFAGIPEALLESARLDGAGELKIFVTVGIPLGASGIISAMVLSFLEYWNLIEQPLAFLKDKTQWPLSLLLPDITLENAGVAFAASVVSLLPPLFVFLLGQDYLEQGIAATAIKE